MSKDESLDALIARHEAIVNPTPDPLEGRIAELERKIRVELNALRSGQNELDTRLTVVEEKTANVHLF